MDKSFKTFLKNSLKIVFDYGIVLIIFGVFIATVIGLAKSNFERWIGLYSFTIFLLMFFMIYNDMKDLAIKEKRPQYNINPKPFKGVFYGLVAIVPFLLILLAYPFINVPKEFVILKLRLMQGFAGPLYWLAKWISGEYWSYIVAFFVIPVISMLGYWAGYREFYFASRLKALIKKKDS